MNRIAKKKVKKCSIIWLKKHNWICIKFHESNMKEKFNYSMKTRIFDVKSFFLYVVSRTDVRVPKNFVLQKVIEIGKKRSNSSQNFKS